MRKPFIKYALRRLFVSSCSTSSGEKVKNNLDKCRAKVLNSVCKILCNSLRAYSSNSLMFCRL